MLMDVYLLFIIFYLLLLFISCSLTVGKNVDFCCSSIGKQKIKTKHTRNGFLPGVERQLTLICENIPSKGDWAKVGSL